MLDIKLIREQADLVRARLAARGAGDDKLIDLVLQFDEKRRAALVEVETLKAQRNRVSKEIGSLMAQKKADEAEARKRRDTRDRRRGSQCWTRLWRSLKASVMRCCFAFQTCRTPVSRRGNQQRITRSSGRGAPSPPLISSRRATSTFASNSGSLTLPAERSCPAAAFFFTPAGALNWNEP